MKKLLSLLLLAATLVLTKADGIALTSLTSGVASNLLAGSFVIQNLTIINTSTNINIVKFWDKGTATTNVVRQAYTGYASYATNFSTIFTNEAGLLITNSFAGLYTGPTVNSAVTNAAPIIYVIAAPPGVTISRDVTLMVTKGLTAVPQYDTTAVVTYKGNP